MYLNVQQSTKKVLTKKENVLKSTEKYKKVPKITKKYMQDWKVSAGLKSSEKHEKKEKK